MRDYLIKRLLLLIPTMLGITIITFFIIQLAPGNPVERKLQLDEGIKSEAITQQIVEETKKLYGLDKPIYERYWIWLKQIATLKLIGAADRTIIAMIVQQALALGGIGFVIGAALIVNMKDYFPRRVVLDYANVMVLGVIVFAVCLVSSGLGVRAALKVDPATALGG